MITREPLPYEASIDYMLTRYPTFFEDLHERLIFADFKKQWTDALPNFPKEKIQDVVVNMKKCLSDSEKKLYHIGAKWLLEEIAKTDVEVK